MLSNTVLCSFSWQFIYLFGLFWISNKNTKGKKLNDHISGKSFEMNINT